MEREFIDHVTYLHYAQKERIAKMEEELVFAIPVKEKTAQVQAEAFAKVMDDNIVHDFIIGLTNIGVMGETLKVSKAAKTDKVIHQEKEHAFKHSATSNKATLREKDALDVVIVYSTSSSPPTLNYALLTIVTKDQVQEMIGQAMDSFVERQRQENDQFKISL